MLKIMYAVIPPEKCIADLHGLHYQQYQIIKTKFIADTEEGTLFAALVESIDVADMIQNAVLVKKSARLFTRNFNDCVSDNAKRKQFRKQNNLVMTGKNWKQFVDKKNTILANFKRVTNKSEQELAELSS